MSGLLKKMVYPARSIRNKIVCDLHGKTRDYAMAHCQTGNPHRSPAPVFLSVVFLFLSLAPRLLQGATYNGTFYFYTPLTLSAVQLSELGLSSSGVAATEGSYTADASWDGSLTEQTMSIDQVYTSTAVQRSKITLWYYRYNKNEKAPTFTTVGYSIRNASGTENRLSHATDQSSLINATIARDSESSPTGTGTYRYIYGYANISIDIASAKKSGTYRGIIQVTINYI